MNSQLHDMLDQHSHDVHDLPVTERLDSIRGRVRVVRRRRRAGLAGAAAAVIAAVGVAVWLPSPARFDPAANRDLAGHTAPETFTSLGYTYAFSEAVRGDGKAVLDLPESDQPVLVSWASSTGSGQLRSDVLFDDDDGTIGMGDADFGDFEYVSLGLPVRVVATGGGEVAMAVYTRTDAAPPGVSNEGVTFREDRGGDRLIDAVIGDRGETDLAFTITMPERLLMLRTFCFGLPKGYQNNLTINGELSSFGSCDDGRPLDGSSEGITLSEGTPDGHGGTAEPGDQVRVRIWLTGDDGNQIRPSQQAVAAPGAQLGIAAYEQAPGVATVGSWRLPQVIEHDGHRWQFVEVAKSAPGAGPIGLDVQATAVPMLVLASVAGTGEGDGAVRFLLDGEPGDLHYIINGWQGVVAVVREGTHRAELRMDGDVGPQVVLGLATYERID